MSETEKLDTVEVALYENGCGCGGSFDCLTHKALKIYREMKARLAEKDHEIERLWRLAERRFYQWQGERTNAQETEDKLAEVNQRIAALEQEVAVLRKFGDWRPGQKGGAE